MGKPDDPCASNASKPKAPRPCSPTTTSRSSESDGRPSAECAA